MRRLLRRLNRRMRRLWRRTPDNFLDLAAWNTYTANHDANVAETLNAWVRLYQPDVFALSEATTHADVLAEVAPLLGYTVLQEKPARRQARGDDTGDVALLVGAHVDIRHSWTARMRRAWMVMRYRRRHQPHRYEVANLRVRGHRWRVRASHFPTGGFDGGNAPAFQESARKSKRWLQRAVLTLTPSVDVGDLNEKLARLAAYYGQRFRVFGKGIDVAATRLVRWCSWAELGTGGSDHRGRLYRFVA